MVGSASYRDVFFGGIYLVVVISARKITFHQRKIQLSFVNRAQQVRCVGHSDMDGGFRLVQHKTVEHKGKHELANGHGCPHMQTAALRAGPGHLFLQSALVVAHGQARALKKPPGFGEHHLFSLADKKPGAIVFLQMSYMLGYRWLRNAQFLRSFCIIQIPAYRQKGFHPKILHELSFISYRS